MASMKAFLQLGRFIGTRQYSQGVPEHIPVHQLAKNTRTSYNDYPVPSGSWQEHYNKQQSRWNRNLAFAVGLLCFTIGSGSRVFYFHYHPGFKRLQNINPKR